MKQYICFDFECYISKETGQYDAFFITRTSGVEHIFRDPIEFLNYIILEGSKNNKPIILVGFNSTEFDLTILVVWVYFVNTMSDGNIVALLNQFMQYWIASNKDYNAFSFYHKVDVLSYNENYPDIDVDAIKNVIKNTHPSFAGRQILGFNSIQAPNNEVYFFDLRKVYPNGKLKIRSLIEGVEIFRNEHIVDFRYGEPQETAIVERYAGADLIATEGLLFKNDDCISYIDACYQTIQTYNLSHMKCIIDSTDCIKAIPAIRSYFKPLEPQIIDEDKTQDVRDFLLFEQELSRITGINFYADEYKVYKNIKGVSVLRYTVPLVKKIKSTGDTNFLRGGLHNAEDYTILESHDNILCFEADFASLYPNIQASNLCPVTTEVGKLAIKNNIKSREILKKRGDATQSVFKLINNTIYGLIPHYVNMATKAFHKSCSLKQFAYTTDYVTRIGQASLILFIQFIVDKFDWVKIANVNTDAVMCQVTGYTQEQVSEIINEFNQSFTLHESKINLTFYKNIIIFNTNCYIKIGLDNKISYMGSRLSSVKNHTAQSITSPIFINCKDIFFDILNYYLTNNIQLTSIAILTELSDVIDQVIQKHKVYMFDSVNQEVYNGVRGKILDHALVKENSLSNSNFMFTEEGSTDAEFCKAFFNGLLSNFFTYDYATMVDEFKLGKAFTRMLYGKDIVKSKHLTNDPSGNVLFINSLLHKVVDVLEPDTSCFKVVKGGKLTVEKIEWQTPLEFFDLCINNSNRVFTPVQLEKRDIKVLMPYVYDFDFKCKTNKFEQLEAKQKLIKELKLLYNRFPQFFLLIEWNDLLDDVDTIATPIKKNGVHVIVLGILENKAVFKNLINEFESYLDKNPKTYNITLYSPYMGRERQRLGSPELISQYVTRLFSTFYVGSEYTIRGETKTEIVNNAQSNQSKMSERHLSLLTDKFLDYIDPYTSAGVKLTEDQATFVNLTIHKTVFEFQPSRSEWFKQLGSIKSVFRFLMVNLGFDDQDELAKTFIFEMLIKLCVNCKMTGKAHAYFNIEDAVKVCKDQVYQTYGTGITSLMGRRNEKYFKIFSQLYNLTGTRYKDIDNMSAHKLMKMLISLYLDVDQAESKQINGLTADMISNKVNFISAATGIGKTHNIVELVKQFYLETPNNYLTLVFSPAKVELEQLLERLTLTRLNLKIGMYHDDVKSDFDENLSYDVILVTGAYLNTANLLPSALEFCLTKHKERGVEIITVMDEIDLILSGSGSTIPLIVPYKVASVQLKGKIDIDLHNKHYEAIAAIQNLPEEQRNYILHLLEDSSKTSQLVPLKGYDNVNSRGSCIDGCFLDQETRIHIDVSCARLGKYGKIYHHDNITVPYIVTAKEGIYHDGSVFYSEIKDLNPEDLLGEVLIDTPALQIYKPSENLVATLDPDKAVSKAIKENICYISRIVRCKFHRTNQYVANDELPCGTYRLHVIKQLGYKNVIDEISTSTFLLTATKDIKTEGFLSDYDVSYYVLNNETQKLDDVCVHINFDRVPDRSRKVVNNNLGDNTYELKEIVFLNRADRIHLDEFQYAESTDLVLKGDLKSSITCTLHEDVLPTGETVINIPNVKGSVISFSKSNLARSLTIKAANHHIEFGNTGRIYDTAFIEYLVSRKDKINNDLINVMDAYDIYNGNLALSNAIQTTGRALRLFVDTENGDINLTGRDIHLYIKSSDTFYLYKILANIVKRSNTDTLQVINSITNEDLKSLIDLI